MIIEMVVALNCIHQMVSMVLYISADGILGGFENIVHIVILYIILMNIIVVYQLLPFKIVALMMFIVYLYFLIGCSVNFYFRTTREDILYGCLFINIIVWFVNLILFVSIS